MMTASQKTTTTTTAKPETTNVTPTTQQATIIVRANTTPDENVETPLATVAIGAVDRNELGKAKTRRRRDNADSSGSSRAQMGKVRLTHLSICLATVKNNNFIYWTEVFRKYWINFSKHARKITAFFRYLLVPNWTTMNVNWICCAHSKSAINNAMNQLYVSSTYNKIFKIDFITCFRRNLLASISGRGTRLSNELCELACGRYSWLACGKCFYYCKMFRKIWLPTSFYFNTKVTQNADRLPTSCARLAYTAMSAAESTNSAHAQSGLLPAS